MIASDVMTADVVTVRPDASVRDVARLLVERRISAVPVVDEGGRLVGIVSEGDLMHRPESETERRRSSWWLELFSAGDELAAAYSKAHGSRAGDVMTRAVVTVAEDTPLAEIARILEENHIKRVPVVRDGRPIGIVSRANLLHGLVSAPPAKPAPVAASDRSIRDQLLAALRKEPWAQPPYTNATVVDGVAHLWGFAATDEELRAFEVAAAGIPGVKSVENHLHKLDPRLFIGGDA